MKFNVIKWKEIFWVYCQFLMLLSRRGRGLKINCCIRATANVYERMTCIKLVLEK